MKKLRVLIGGLLIAGFILGQWLPAAAGEGPLNLVPEDAVIVIALRNLKTDEGMSYLLKLWKEHLLQGGDYRDKATIEEIYARSNFSQVLGAMLIRDKAAAFQYIVMINLPDGQKADSLIEKLNTLLRGEQGLQTISYLNYRITYAVDYKEGKLSAYTRIGNALVVGSGIDVLKEVVRVKRGGGSLLTESKGFNEIRAELVEPWDGFVYINNRNLKFAKLLRRWEEKANMTFLMSAEVLKGIGISFDIVSKDVIKGRIFFLGKSEVALDDMNDDARFFSEVIRRKLIPEDVEYTSDVITEGEHVTLNFEAGRLETFWTSLIEKEKIEIGPRVVPGGKDSGEKEENLLLRRLAPGRLIFILILIVFVLIFGIFVRRQRG